MGEGMKQALADTARILTITAILILFLVACGGKSGGRGNVGGGEGPAVLYEHLKLADRRARAAVAKVEGRIVVPNLPKLVFRRATARDRVYWTIPQPGTGFGAQAYHTGDTIVLASPPDGKWSARDIQNAIEVLNHEAGHSYIRSHDARYDRYFPLWAWTRSQIGY